MKTTHIIPSNFAASRLQQSIAINPALEGEIISLHDELGIGPVRDLHTSEGQLQRKRWLQTEFSQDIEFRVDKWLEDHDKIRALAKTNNLCIWAGKNTRDQLMMARLLHTLRPALERIFIVPVSDHPVIIRSKVFYATTINVLDTPQISTLGSHIRPLLQSEMDNAINTWANISISPSIFRTLNEFGVIEPQNESFYDQALLARCGLEFQRAVRVIGHTIADINFDTTDIFLNWRLKELVKQKKLESKGTLKLIQDYEVKLNG